MSSNLPYRERLEALFADIERLAANPSVEILAFQLQIEELRARLHRLEAEIQARAYKAEPQPQAPAVRDPLPVEETKRRSSPLLYEKEFVGFAFSDGKMESLRHAIPPNGYANVAVPLIVSGQTVGDMQIAVPSNRALTPEETELLNAVAQRAVQQIEALRLLSEAERARAEAEFATRKFIHESWDAYLDAIHQSERIGYAYDQSAVTPFIEKPADEGVVEAVKVMDEQVGRVFVKPDPARPLSKEDREIIAAVARQVAQQVENIRLLADAARARAEAEEATRRFTRQNWDAYISHKDRLGFVYDTNNVLSIEEVSFPEHPDVSKPLTVRGETIGHLAVAGGIQLTPDALEMLDAIADRVSVHLETLRLNEELQKRAEELKELDRLKSAFLANMSHELRTPLNSILGFTDVMLEGLDGPLTENMANDLQLIQKNGQHLLHLINDVLDMAKIESGRMNLTLEKFRLHETIEEVASITSPLASEKNIALFIEADSDREVEIFADRTRIRQVLINLVNNAIKFTDTGKISIRAARHDDHVLITVRDTGIGIPPDKLEAIFQEFTQVDTSTTRKVGGTGLGLPISRRLVEMHGGRLWAESSGVNGEGSTFYISLPIEAKLVEPEMIE